MRLITLALISLLVINVYSVFLLNSEASFQPLSEGFSWTYQANLQRFSQSKNDPLLDFDYRETLDGSVTIININESIISLEDKFLVKRYRLAGTGDVWDPAPYSFIFRDEIDRTTLTYTRTTIEDFNGSKEIIEADFGEPAREFISTSITEGQQVEYDTVFVSKALCYASYDEFDFHGSNIPVITLTYTGQSDRSEEPDTNGFAECIYIFEKATGLMIWAFESEEVESNVSVETSTYYFNINQISSQFQERTIIPEFTPKKTPQQSPIIPSWNIQNINLVQDLDIDPVLIALAIIMIVIVASLVLTLIFLKKGKGTPKDDLEQNGSGIDYPLSIV